MPRLDEPHLHRDVIPLKNACREGSSACGEERAQAGDPAIRRTKIGRPISRMIQSWCLTSTDSATTERTPPGPASRATITSTAEDGQRDRALRQGTREKGSKIADRHGRVVLSGDCRR